MTTQYFLLIPVTPFNLWKPRRYSLANAYPWCWALHFRSRAQNFPQAPAFYEPDSCFDFFWTWRSKRSTSRPGQKAAPSNTQINTTSPGSFPLQPQLLHVLYEHAVGYSLFKVKEFEEIGLLQPEVEASVTDLSRFNTIVKLVAFSPFKSSADSLHNINSISEGKKLCICTKAIRPQKPNRSAAVSHWCGDSKSVGESWFLGRARL